MLLVDNKVSFHTRLIYHESMMEKQTKQSVDGNDSSSPRGAVGASVRGKEFRLPPSTQVPSSRDPFPSRARALFLSRLVLDGLGLAVIVVPAWSRALGLAVPTALGAYLFLLSWHTLSFLAISTKAARPVTFLSLCFDLLALTYLGIRTGGLHSPIMQGQLVYTVFFAILFPSPLAILPPLLVLPIMTKVQQLLGMEVAPRDLLLLLWSSILNSIVVVVVVYLDRKREGYLAEVLRLQGERRKAAVEAERNRIARELHDGLGAVLSGILLEVEFLRSKIGGQGWDEELDELEETAAEGMAEMRGAVAMMRRGGDLASILEDYGRSWSQRTKIPVDWAGPGRSEDIAADVGWCFFRVFQEALTNVAKHAEASRVRAGLEYGDEFVRLWVEDDGRGFDVESVPSGRYGLDGIRHRLEGCGGRLEISSSPGRGTKLLMLIPRGPRAADHGLSA